MEEHHHHEMPENTQNSHREHNHSAGKGAHGVYENVGSNTCHSHGGGTHGNHGGGHMMHMGNLKQRFWISLIVAIPIILLSPMMGLNLPFQFSFPGSDWIVLVLASFLFFYGGKPFFSSARMELKDRDPAMMTLISMGIAVAYVYSLYAFISNHLFHDAGHKMDFFWELATLIVIMLLGHWIEMKAVGNAGNALQKMAELLPGSAHLLNSDGVITDVPLQDIRVGEHVIVKSGEKMATDGKVISGETTVNESMVTGEAKSVVKHVGDRVIGGSVNGNGTITIEVTGTGESGYLAQVMKLVEGAQQEKSKSETISDKVAKALFYVAVVAGILAFIVWLVVTKDVNIALERLVTVLVIACPHALGLAIPLVVARSISMGAQHGLLIRNRNALEKAKKLSVVAMDKTGTLTEGDFHVSDIGSLSGKWSEDDVLRMMASLESKSNHPLGVGILNEAKKKDLPFPEAENVQVINGMGLSGTIDHEEVKIVSAAWLEKNKRVYDKEHFRILSGQGNSVSYLVVNNVVAGYVAQGDQVKAQAEAAVSELNRLQIKPVMLTGDNEGFARSVGYAVGISEVHAGLLPEDKEKVIAGYKHEGKVVMMVGDGVNDAPALARADIGMAIGAGTDVAIDSADVVLVKSNPFDIIHFLSLAKNTTRKMVQNLWWGAGYNIIAIPLAAGVLAPVGIILSPAVGAILMSCSTIIVAINAMALKMK